MGSIGPVQLIIVAILILVLFGRGRISEMMGDFGKGVSSFKKGMADDDSPAAPPPSPQIEAPTPAPAPAPAPTESTSATATSGDKHEA